MRLRASAIERDPAEPRAAHSPCGFQRQEVELELEARAELWATFTRTARCGCLGERYSSSASKTPGSRKGRCRVAGVHLQMRARSVVAGKGAVERRETRACRTSA